MRKYLLDPLHRCSWTRRRRTHLQLAPPWLYSAGGTLRACLFAAASPDVVWFSSMYGDDEPVSDGREADYDLFTDWDFNGKVHIENMLLLAVRRSLATDLLQFSRPIRGPVTHYLAADHDIAELELTDSVAASLGLDDPRDAIFHRPAGIPDSITCAVHSHDECFATLGPCTDVLIGHVMEHVLEMHAFYLGRDYDWNGVVPDPVSLLEAHNELEMRAHPQHGTAPPSITVRVGPRKTVPIHQRLWSALRRANQPQSSIHFEGEKAILAPGW